MSLGENGGGLGFAKISGIAVAFDTYKNAANPSNNFVGISDGAAKTAGQLHWLATSTSIPALRTAVRHVKVETLNGTVTVWVDGAKALSATVALPPKVLLGFTRRRRVLHRRAQGGQRDCRRRRGSHRTATRRTAAKRTAGGEPQDHKRDQRARRLIAGGTQLAFSGTCPSSFTTGALGNGANATPALTGAVAGASCSVAEAAPSASGWKTTASVNGAAPVELTAAGGKLTIPTFALVAGANTVAVTNTYTPSEGEGAAKIPDPSAGGWQLNGSTKLEGQNLVLTGATGNQAGSAFWPVRPVRATSTSNSRSRSAAGPAPTVLRW